MEINDGIRRAVESDLGLNAPFVKGQSIPVRNCWHFSTNGNLVDFLFASDEDFVAGTNRIFVLSQKYCIVILAYVLMDTHVHFVLWGKFEECAGFVHEYIRLTSMYLSSHYDDRHKLSNLSPDYQVIGEDRYLKTVICYVIKNPPVGGIQFSAWDYPWSSGPLFFRKKSHWTFSGWESQLTDSSSLPPRQIRKILKTDKAPVRPFKLIGSMVFPGEFVAVEIVERIFKTYKGYNYFMCISKESDVESINGSISRLSIPIAELQQHKTELCREKFGVETIRSLSTSQRLALARMLLSRYNSSPKQVVRSCGLIFSEVSSMI